MSASQISDEDICLTSFTGANTPRFIFGLWWQVGSDGVSPWARLAAFLRTHGTYKLEEKDGKIYKLDTWTHKGSELTDTLVFSEQCERLSFAWCLPGCKGLYMTRPIPPCPRISTSKAVHQNRCVHECPLSCKTLYCSLLRECVVLKSAFQ